MRFTAAMTASKQHGTTTIRFSARVEAVLPMTLTSNQANAAAVAGRVRTAASVKMTAGQRETVVIAVAEEGGHLNCHRMAKQQLPLERRSGTPWRS
jgi:hypothetical protein